MKTTTLPSLVKLTSIPLRGLVLRPALIQRKAIPPLFNNFSMVLSVSTREVVQTQHTILIKQCQTVNLAQF